MSVRHNRAATIATTVVGCLLLLLTAGRVAGRHLELLSGRYEGVWREWQPAAGHHVDTEDETTEATEATTARDGKGMLAVESARAAVLQALCRVMGRNFSEVAPSRWCRRSRMNGPRASANVTRPFPALLRQARSPSADDLLNASLFARTGRGRLVFSAYVNMSLGTPPGGAVRGWLDVIQGTDRVAAALDRVITLEGVPAPAVDGGVMNRNGSHTVQWVAVKGVSKNFDLKARVDKLQVRTIEDMLQSRLLHGSPITTTTVMRPVNDSVLSAVHASSLHPLSTVASAAAAQHMVAPLSNETGIDSNVSVLMDVPSQATVTLFGDGGCEAFGLIAAHSGWNAAEPVWQHLDRADSGEVGSFMLEGILVVLCEEPRNATSANSNASSVSNIGSSERDRPFYLSGRIYVLQASKRGWDDTVPEDDYSLVMTILAVALLVASGSASLLLSHTDSASRQQRLSFFTLLNVALGNFSFLVFTISALATHPLFTKPLAIANLVMMVVANGVDTNLINAVRRAQAALADDAAPPGHRRLDAFCLKRYTLFRFLATAFLLSMLAGFLERSALRTVYMVLMVPFVSQIVMNAFGGPRWPRGTVDAGEGVRCFVWCHVVGRCLLSARVLSGPTLNDPLAAFVACAVVAAQGLLLEVQWRHGPQAIVPPCWRPTAYSYAVDQHVHRSAMLLSGDCAVCLNPLAQTAATTAAPPHLSVRRRSDDAGAAADERGEPAAAQARPHHDEREGATEERDDDIVWKTPCNHYFHRDCLLQAMESRVACPICRRTLPLP